MPAHRELVGKRGSTNAHADVRVCTADAVSRSS